VYLVTYLPFYRIHEVETYFMRNVEVMKPRAAIVYVDNVYHEKQREILARVLSGNVEVRFGNWRNRNNTWIAMLRDFHTLGGEVMVVDSDNSVTEDLPRIHSELRSHPIYTILDEEAWNETYPGYTASSGVTPYMQYLMRRRGGGSHNVS